MQHPSVMLDMESPSSRGRGLKSIDSRGNAFIDCVALFTRAWIEISSVMIPPACRSSPSSRGRGLKFIDCLGFAVPLLSPSSRGRGLKYQYIHQKYQLPTSPSSRGRGLKCLYFPLDPPEARRPLHEGVD